MPRPPGSIALYRKGLELESNPATTQREWQAFREEVRQANIRWRFESKRTDEITVITNERQD